MKTEVILTSNIVGLGAESDHVKVSPGDLVVADDTGVCFIPRDHILEVLELAEKKSKAEDARCTAIDNGMPVPDISRSTYGEK